MIKGIRDTGQVFIDGVELLPEIALSFYQSFKWTVIAALPAGDFELPVEGVKNWLKCNTEGEE